MTALFGIAREWWALDETKRVRFGSTGSSRLVRERFAPGCFSEWIATRPVKLLWGHDPEIELASTIDETLSVFEDEIGLCFYANPRAGFDRYIDQVIIGRARWMSIGPMTSDFRYEEVSGELVRTVLESSLKEISITDHPASYRTEVRAAQSVPIWMMRRRLDAIERGL